MKIIWSNLASESLKNIFQYHKDIVGNAIAQKLKANIFDSTKQLNTYPNSGQIEESLELLEEGHRYLVRGNYKVIYKKVKEGILITDIFDTRQDPLKINHSDR